MQDSTAPQFILKAAQNSGFLDAELALAPETPFQEMVTQLQTLRQHPEVKIQIFAYTGLSLLKVEEKNHLKLALRTLRQAPEIGQANLDLLFFLAERYLKNQQLIPAQKIFELLFRSVEKGELKRQITWNLGILAYKARQYKSALSYFDALVHELHQAEEGCGHDSKWALGDVHYQRGRVLRNMSLWAEACTAFQSALEHPLNTLAAKVHYQLALSLINAPPTNSVPQASLILLHLNRALEEFTTEQRRPDMGRCAFQLGKIHQERQDTLKALEAYQKALDHLPDKAVQVRADTAYRSGECFLAFKKYDEALMMFQFAMQLFAQCQQRLGEGMSSLKIALLYLERAQVEPCVEWSEKSVAILEHTADPKPLKMALDLLVDLSRLQRKRERVQYWKDKRDALLG